MNTLFILAALFHGVFHQNTFMDNSPQITVSFIDHIDFCFYSEKRKETDCKQFSSRQEIHEDNTLPQGIFTDTFTDKHTFSTLAEVQDFLKKTDKYIAATYVEGWLSWENIWKLKEIIAEYDKNNIPYEGTIFVKIPFTDDFFEL